MRQKRMAVINDLACYGRCALAVSLPIISSMNIECCPLPTAFLSSNGAFQGHTCFDTTSQLELITEHWKQLQLPFDGITSGFLCSNSQAEVIQQFVSSHKSNGCSYFLDPVMGDNGSLYSVVSEDICEGFQQLLPLADVIVPNLTECCRLLSIPFPETIPQEEELFSYAERLSRLGPKQVVITGISVDIGKKTYIKNIVFSRNEISETVIVPKIGSDRCGTGDVFHSVLSGSLLQGISLEHSVRRAADFLCKALSYTNKLGISPKNGVCFEAYLPLLAPSADITI